MPLMPFMPFPAPPCAAICARFAAAALRMAAAPLCALQNGVFPTAPHRHPSNAQIFPLWWMMQ
jgi:hypothetical protein